MFGLCVPAAFAFFFCGTSAVAPYHAEGRENMRRPDVEREVSAKRQGAPVRFAPSAAWAEWEAMAREEHIAFAFRGASVGHPCSPCETIASGGAVGPRSSRSQIAGFRPRSNNPAKRMAWPLRSGGLCVFPCCIFLTPGALAEGLDSSEFLLATRGGRWNAKAAATQRRMALLRTGCGPRPSPSSFQEEKREPVFSWVQRADGPTW